MLKFGCRNALVRTSHVILHARTLVVDPHVLAVTVPFLAGSTQALRDLFFIPRGIEESSFLRSSVI